MILWHTTMSLDGFIAGPGDAMEWVFENPEPSALADEMIETTGALVVGRRTYEVEHRYRGGFVSDGIEDAVSRASAAAGDRNVGVFGAEVARQCVEHGLLDEIVIHLAPILLGDGVRLFGSPGTERVDLERISAGGSGQVTDLRFRVVKQLQLSEA